jgi:TPR repeat protein
MLYYELDEETIAQYQNGKLQKQAEAGDKKAQYDLGYYLLRKMKTSDMLEVGAQWLEKAAAQNLVDAWYALAHYYRFDKPQTEENEKI